MILSKREKLLLAVLAVFLLGGGLFLATQKISNYKLDLRREIAKQERLLTQVHVAARRLEQYSKRPSKTLGRVSLIGHVEQLATNIALKNQLRLNPVAQTGMANVQGVDVRLDNLTMDDVLGFIHAVEHADPVLLIDRVEIIHNFRQKDLLRLTARVLAEK